ncbi:L-2,4-diaminobutyrate decarboxylase [bioreactor metagenome]|uniref:L-2,4-diaminobutyrate decarboxylase n=1 Tax=bioreactor metagenome TaxID=1076179 RepID=A0A644T9F4_9ZZZZ|nr:aminotransferase class I/II-fold pyridoxal phosphate-dependent enzyme [Lentimicrobium sp.]MEA5109326.1 aminotransferase class I/II-fold pyridoxal phosphate-dependent enzyme [Lentimicrobium sp.]
MNPLLEKAFDPEDFRREGHKLVDLLTSYLESCRQKAQMPVLPPSDPETMAGFWKNDLQNPGFDLQSFYSTLIAQSNHIHHPRYMGHQVVPPAPLSALTELLEALLNNGMAIYEMGPASTAIERVVLQWLAQRLGMPDAADGVLTSGGSAGNLTALLAARQAMCGHNIWEEGNQDHAPLAIMVSDEAHYSVARAARIMGWGEKGVVKVPVNDRMQLDAGKLKETLHDAKALGLQVIALVGNACSTSTGSYDPLSEMADFAQENNLWFHVDGAHGGAAALTKKYSHLTKGIEKADSVVIDFHKMMLAPALTTAVLFKNGAHSYETFAQKAAYLLASGAKKPWYDSAGRTLECTKKMLGVKVYAMIKLYGDKLFIDYVETAYDLGQEFFNLLNQQTDFEPALKPDGNIVCFRYSPKGFTGDVSLLNAEIRKKILLDARFYVVQTQIQGQVYLRVTLMNPFTEIADLNDLLLLIRELGNGIMENANA